MCCSQHACNDSHPEMNFGTTFGKPGVVCTWYSADGVLQESVEYGVVQGGMSDRVAFDFDIALKPPRRSEKDQNGDTKVLSTRSGWARMSYIRQRNETYRGTKRLAYYCVSAIMVVISSQKMSLSCPVLFAIWPMDINTDAVISVGGGIGVTMMCCTKMRKCQMPFSTWATYAHRLRVLP